MVNSSWKDLDTHGRRLVKIIKILEAKIPKTKDDIDGLSRLSATIGTLTKQTVELIKLVDNYDQIISWFSTLEKDELVIKVPESMVVIKKVVQEYEGYLRELKSKVYTAFMEKCGDHSISENLTRQVFEDFNLPDI